MLTLIDWIRKNISSEDSSGSTAGLLHGDFRMDNLGFHPIELYIADFSQGKVKHNNGFELDISEGVPSLEEHLADYCSAAIRSSQMMLIIHLIHIMDY
ncbi:putative protein kinase-like domain superfamily [Helianthus annuus]|uniref:Aminoglycoside phosphotransferase domain-containing protein n=1 Tax=Helianthus annuus TaxID=4232 RepID=A0A9K3DW54_HELAN|nr:putative protein kinase-like domain superfamily [Helianthus annuus]